ncbi:adenosylcobinamide-phosphate synthase CbiB [Proteinivorax hydrogeniformans]|uniref:Cobalamin biosynthesis protein CobD n=1 Tax=Proteinivorax hydrogeniformans TaxID=1826727 RepID=A0AAU8HVE7_9FIRM
MISIWLACALDVMIGDPHYFFHPVRLIGNYIEKTEKLIRGRVKSDRGLQTAGVFLLLSTVILTFAVTTFLLWMGSMIHFTVFFSINTILLWTSIASKSLKAESMKVYRALTRGNIEEARVFLSYIVGRDTKKLKDREIVQATVETVAENTSDGVIAPLFYAFIGGAPLALTYKAVNTLDSMVGYKNEKYRFLGWASAKVDDVANFLPARITAVLMVLSSIFIGLDKTGSWRVMCRDHAKHTSPNAGFPEAAVAGALRIRLGGPSYYLGNKVEKPYIGDFLKQVDLKDIKKTNSLMYISSFLALIIFSVLRLFIFSR